MYFFLNGGRDERAVLKSSAAVELYKKIGIQHILFIPFAITEDYWQVLWHDNQDLFGMPACDVRSLTMLDTDPHIIQQKIAWADCIYFPGGAPMSLLKRVEDAGVTKLIRQAIAIGSLKLLAGGSAGAMVMGSDCIIGNTEVKTVVTGLNFVADYVIDSHFGNRHRESRLLQILADRPHLKGMGIDEDTGVVLNDNLALQAVYGPGTVKVYHKTNIETYDSNFRFPT